MKSVSPKKKTKAAYNHGAKSAAYKPHGNKAPATTRRSKQSLPSTTASKWAGRYGASKDPSTVKNAS